jgi:hypothetical protein
LTLAEIKALPVARLAARDAVLWLWATNAHLPDAFEVAREWGFSYKTTLTWVKPRMGTGDWLRGRTEHCLLAVRGRPARGRWPPSRRPLQGPVTASCPHSQGTPDVRPRRPLKLRRRFEPERATDIGLPAPVDVTEAS